MKKKVGKIKQRIRERGGYKQRVKNIKKKGLIMLYIRWSRGGSCARANTEAHKEFLVLTRPRDVSYHYSRSFALKKKTRKKRRDKKEKQIWMKNKI